MKKYAITLIWAGFGSIALLLLLDFLFFEKGPLLSLAEKVLSKDGKIEVPGNFYIKAILGLSLFTFYGFINRHNHEILWPRMWKNWMVPTSLVLAILFFTHTSSGSKLFRPLFAEDGLFENLTFLFLFISSILFLYAVILIKKDFKKAPKIWFSLLCLFTFFVGMEEISWGQRIFDIPTPESFMVGNE